MRRPVAVALICMTATTLGGCESSQTRSARLKAASSSSAPEERLKIARSSQDVHVTSSTVLTDKSAQRSAAVITLRNTSNRPQAALPLLFELTDAAGKQVFMNNSPGASTDLVSVPSLAPRATLAWVDDAIVNVRGARDVKARVGATTGPSVPSEVPSLRISGTKLERDESGVVTAVGRIVNTSTLPQERLVVFASARRGSKIVAAGRAVVPMLKPGAKGSRFTLFFVGDPTGAKLSFQAPPVNLGASK